MNRISSFFFLLFSSLLCIPYSSASEMITTGSGDLIPSIESQDSIQVGKRIYLDASTSTVPMDGVPTTYSWETNGIKQDGKEAYISFDIPGEYSVLLTLQHGEKREQRTKKIFVYRKTVTFLYTGSSAAYQNTMPEIKKLAKENGIRLFVIGDDKNEQVQTEDTILQSLLQNADTINDSNEIVVGPKSLDALAAYKKFLTLSTPKENTQDLILTTQSDFWLYSKVLWRVAQGLHGTNITFLRQDAFAVLNFLLQSNDITHFKQKFDPNDLEQINQENNTFSPWLPLSFLIDNAIANGLPSSVLSFLLLIPFILMLIAFIKQCIGIETLGLLQTLILVLAFYILGIKYGTFMLFFIIILGIVLRTLLSKIIQFYIPRVTLTLSFATLAILLLVVFGSSFNATFGIDTSSSQRALISLLPVLLIAFQADKLSYKIFSRTPGTKELIVLFATYLEVILAFLLARAELLKLLLLALPELVFIAIIGQFIISRYTGLRIVEIVRFRELLLHDLEE